MVKVVSSVAVYVTLESAKVVGDCVSISVNIDTALQVMSTYWAVGGVCGSDHGSPVGTCPGPCIHHGEQADERAQSLEQLHCVKS